MIVILFRIPSACTSKRKDITRKLRRDIIRKPRGGHYKRKPQLKKNTKTLNSLFSLSCFLFPFTKCKPIVYPPSFFLSNLENLPYWGLLYLPHHSDLHWYQTQLSRLLPVICLRWRSNFINLSIRSKHSNLISMRKQKN